MSSLGVSRVMSSGHRRGQGEKEEEEWRRGGVEGGREGGREGEREGEREGGRDGDVGA